ncbi:MAG: ABC transporter permease [Phycisphaeraceae bacterium]|nr:ABC transporter permease [Phycisphaeraceae bacterium]
MRLPRWVSVFGPPAVSFVLLSAGAELAVRLAGVPAYLVPPPSAVFAAIVREWPALGWAGTMTCAAAVLGFGISALVGMLLAVLLSTSRLVQRAFYPYAIFFQTVPIVAISPMLVIWFGYGIRAVVASAFIVSVFPVIANTLTGLLSTDPALSDMFRLYGASGGAKLWKLRVPSALPSIFTGLRIAAGLAVIGTIVGEFIGGGGIGMLVQAAIREQRTDLIFAAVLLASVLGLLLFGLVNFGAWLMLRRWHASATTRP